MQVRTRFAFDELQLRSIAAASGHGGRATRKECLTFIDRAVRQALDKAPDAKPARTPRPKTAPIRATSPDTPAEARARRTQIAGMYRTSGATMQDLADRTREEGRAIFNGRPL